MVGLGQRIQSLSVETAQAAFLGVRTSDTFWQSDQPVYQQGPQRQAE